MQTIYKYNVFVFYFWVNLCHQEDERKMLIQLPLCKQWQINLTSVQKNQKNDGD